MDAPTASLDGELRGQVDPNGRWLPGKTAAVCQAAPGQEERRGPATNVSPLLHVSNGNYQQLEEVSVAGIILCPRRPSTT